MSFIKNIIVQAQKTQPPLSPAVSSVRVAVYDQGYPSSFGIDSSGKVWVWGYNGNGYLGDNTLVDKCTPVSVAGAAKTFCQIVTSGNHSLAIDKRGKVWAWGYNAYGQLGDYSTIDKCSPVSIGGTAKTFYNISAGYGHSLGIDKYGQAWSWGWNPYGQLGNNSIVNGNTPISIFTTFAKTFCQISAGYAHSLGIDNNGQVWAWGYNARGELGDGTITSQCTPVSIQGTAKTFCKISAGKYFFQGYSVGIDKNGQAWGWGYNAYGQLGDNSLSDKCTPVSVAGATKTFCQISAGVRHVMAIDKTGKIWVWGSTQAGTYTLGLGSAVTSTLTPQSVLGTAKTFCQVSAAYKHNIALDKNGNVWAWGQNLYGQVGTGTKFVGDPYTPISIKGNTKTFCKIHSGGVNAGSGYAIDKNGRLWAWGGNTLGEIGLNRVLPDFEITPVSVLGTVRTFCHISAGNSHAASIDKNGKVWCWGNNGTGQLGDNSVTNRSTPVAVAGTAKTFSKISAGYQFVIAIRSTGRLWGWGSNTVGQVGDNTITSRRTPVQVAGAAKTFCEIATGQDFAIAIRSTGRLWGWGSNTVGQVGDNTITSRRTPVQVAGTAKTFCKISAGTSHAAAIDKNGKIWCWGGNASGELGDNTTTSKRTPVSIVGATKTFCQIASGQNYNVAIDKNGKLWAWGLNSSGQLGDNTTTNRSTPVAVAGATKTFCFVTNSNLAFFGIDKNGKLWSWGAAGSQRGTMNWQIATPTRICNL